MPTMPAAEETVSVKTDAPRDALTIHDHRTGKAYEVPIKDDTIRATDLRQIKVAAGDFGMMAYDPAFLNTASCRSKITFIDGDKGILRYRGYPIEQLAAKANYMEVAYLLLHGELPTKDQYEQWIHDITFHTMIHEKLKTFMDGFNHDAHPMGMLIATVAAMSTFYPGARDIHSPEGRTRQIHRLIAKMPTLAAFAYRHSMGMPYVYPDNDFSYTENFLNMLFRIPASSWRPNPVLVHALDVLFILHADHEQNCGTHVMRGIGSSHTDPYSAVAGAAAALYGPLHGGANEEVLKMLEEIGTVSRIPGFIEEVKNGKGEKRLMGFGHRVYKNFDPRATIIKKVAEEVFEVTGRNPLLDVALELERIALQDDYFIKRKLYPNVDFYSGLIYQAIGIPTAAFTVLFAIPRVSGWLAQWQEMLLDPEQKIARPRQIYVGSPARDFVPIEKR
jgi:citrate synthase